MNFQVRVTRAAKEDLRSIFDWIRDRSPAGAETWFRRWEQTLVAIEARADHYGLAPESDGHSEEIRQAIFKTRRGRPYRVLFFIHGIQVVVLYIRGPNQNTLRLDEIRRPDFT